MMMTFLMTAVTLIWKRILMHQVATATIQTTQSQKSGEPAQIYAGRLFAVSSKVIVIKKASEVG